MFEKIHLSLITFARIRFLYGQMHKTICQKASGAEMLTWFYRRKKGFNILETLDELAGIHKPLGRYQPGTVLWAGHRLRRCNRNKQPTAMNFTKGQLVSDRWSINQCSLILKPEVWPEPTGFIGRLMDLTIWMFSKTRFGESFLHRQQQPTPLPLFITQTPNRVN